MASKNFRIVAMIAIVAIVAATMTSAQQPARPVVSETFESLVEIESYSKSIKSKGEGIWIANQP